MLVPSMRWRTPLVALGLAWIAGAFSSACSPGQLRPAGPHPVSFPTPDGGLVVANEYGTGDRGVVLAHGARFDKESWDPEARALAGSGFRVLAIDFRGYGGSRAGSAPQALELDVLAAVRFLSGSGANSVAVVGGSMGGGAAAQAAVAAEPGEIDRLVLLAHAPIDHPERMQGRKLFVVSRGDVDGKGSPRLARIQDQYERAPGPKEIVVLDGSAHAQNIFGTEQGPELSSSILRFLSAP